VGGGQLHAPAALSPGKEPPAPLDRRPGGPRSLSGRGGEEESGQRVLGSLIEETASRYGK